MNKTLFNLYQQRLENLTHTINYLHEIVGVDEALSLLQDERMVKYKIDRVHEIVREIMNSQKQKIILQLIQKCEQDDRLKNQEIDQSQLNYYIKKLDMKAKQSEQSINHLKQARQRIEEEKQINSELKIQIESLQKKHQELKEKYDRFFGQDEEEKQILKEKIRQQDKTILKIQQNLTAISQSNVKSDATQKQLEQRIRSLQEENKHFRMNTRENQPETTRIKIQRIEILKKQIRKLNNDLNQMKQMYSIFRDHVTSSILSQLKILKSSQIKLKQAVQKEFSEILKYVQREMNESVAYILEERQIKIDRKGVLLQRMQNLQGELTEFIEKQILL